MGDFGPPPIMLTDKLTQSDNSKVKFKPNHRNTFGLNFGLPENGGTCPGATQGKGGCLDVRDGRKRPTCYMAKVTQIYKAVGNILQKNTDLLRDKSREDMAQVLKNTFQDFVDRNEEKYWYYRLTYSGDVFSEDFAYAVVDACKAFPKVKFWVYTRSHDYVKILVGAPNLAVYLSVDPINLDTGRKIYNGLREQYNNVGLAYLGPPVDDGTRYVACPETHGKIQNTDKLGACAKCKLCFTYNEKTRLRNITFKIH